MLKARTSIILLATLIPGMAFGQAVVSISPEPKLQFLDNSGRPLVGGKVCSYQAGTTVPLSTYTDSTGTVQNTNPVILDAGGRASIWLLQQSYKFVVYDSTGTPTTCNGNQIYSQDNINPGCVVGVNCISSSANTAFTGNNTHSGTETLSGLLNANGGAFNGSFNIISTGNFIDTAGQNNIMTYLLNGYRHINGNKYACSAAGLAVAISDAQAGLGTTDYGFVDGQSCNPGSTPFTSTISIPANITVQLGFPWICGVANAPCVNLVGTGARLVGYQRTNPQLAIAGQTIGAIIRAGAGVTSSTDLVAVNYQGAGPIENVEIGGITLDFANTNATTGRNCLSALAVSHLYLHEIHGFNCGNDGLHVEAGQGHSYDHRLSHVAFTAVGGNGGTYGANNFLWTSGVGVQQVSGNGATATVTLMIQLCPSNGTSITIAQNSQTGFNGTFTTTGGSGTNACTFASATNATGTGGILTYVGLADIDRVDCIDCIGYGYNPGASLTRFGNWNFHLQAATSATSCTSQNCGGLSDFNFKSSFAQGVNPNPLTASVTQIAGNAATGIATITCSVACPPAWSSVIITGSTHFNTPANTWDVLLTSSGTTATFTHSSGSTDVASITLRYSNNAGLFLEDLNMTGTSPSQITQVYWQGEIEDSFQMNAGTGVRVYQNGCGVLVACFSNIDIGAAGFANYTSQHNMMAGQGGNVWTYQTKLNPPQLFEVGSLRVRPQFPPTATSQNPNCGIVFASRFGGSYCWYQHPTFGDIFWDRIDSGPSHIIDWSFLNSRMIPGSDNTFKIGDHTIASWQEVSTYNLYFRTSLFPLGSGNVLISTTAPTIAGAGCGGSAASIPNNNGTAAFEVNAGTAPSSACTITMPTAAHGWACSAVDVTTNSTSVFYQKQSPAASQTTTQIVITNFNDVAVATNFAANDVVRVSCYGY